MVAKLISRGAVLVFLVGASAARAGVWDTVKDIGKDVRQGVGQVVEKGKQVITGDNTQQLASKEGANQNNLKVYSGENRTGQYMLEGTMWGAGMAAAAKCGSNVILNDKKCSKDVGKFALGGAAVGAFGGYLVANAEEKKRIEAEQIQTDVDRANVDLAEATVATEAARDLAQLRAGELSRLKAEAKKDSRKAGELRGEVAEAKADLKSMRISSGKIKDQIAKIEADRARESDPDNKEKYKEILKELRAQSKVLDEQIDIMDGALADITV